MRHVEGATFSGATADQRIQLIYSYCTPLYCNEFGDTLKKPFPDSIQIPSNSAQLLTLTKTQVIIQNSDTVGILYYNYKEIAKGRLYWKDDTFFKQAVEIDFYMSELESVTKIINSISRK